MVLRRAAALDGRDGRPRVIGVVGQDAGATFAVPPLRHREHDIELLIAG